MLDDLIPQIIGEKELFWLIKHPLNMVHFQLILLNCLIVNEYEPLPQDFDLPGLIVGDLLLKVFLLLAFLFLDHSLDAGGTLRFFHLVEVEEDEHVRSHTK